MKDFIANGKTYILDESFRNRIKPGWEEMYSPVKVPDMPLSLEEMPKLFMCEEALRGVGETLVGKNILEAGCGSGKRCYLMAKYEGTRVHGIDIDEYLVVQSPDMNVWNPEDMEFIHKKIGLVRKHISRDFPEIAVKKVTFSTESMETYTTPDPHDIIIGFDVLEHILDLDAAFSHMANAVKKGGIILHEYNSFFSINGGHSPCTLDFPYGHCRLSKEDFERYIRELRPCEEKVAIGFYNQNLNRATRKDTRELAEKYGLEVIFEVTHSPFTSTGIGAKEDIELNMLPDVVKIYPRVEIEDLLFNSIVLIMRKK